MQARKPHRLRERVWWCIIFVTQSVAPSTQENNLLNQKQDKLHEAIVSLSLGKVESNLRLGPHEHSNGDGAEIIEIERICLSDERVQAEIAKLQLPEGAVVISDPWIYGEY